MSINTDPCFFQWIDNSSRSKLYNLFECAECGATKEILRPFKH